MFWTHSALLYDVERKKSGMTMELESDPRLFNGSVQYMLCYANVVHHHTVYESSSLSSVCVQNPPAVAHVFYTAELKHEQVHAA